MEEQEKRMLELEKEDLMESKKRKAKKKKAKKLKAKSKFKSKISSPSRTPKLLHHTQNQGARTEVIPLHQQKGEEPWQVQSSETST